MSTFGQRIISQKPPRNMQINQSQYKMVKPIRKHTYIHGNKSLNVILNIIVHLMNVCMLWCGECKHLSGWCCEHGLLSLQHLWFLS